MYSGKNSASEGETGWWTRERLMAASLFILTLIVLYGCYLVVRPFLSTLTWSVALAIVVYPLHRRLLARIKWPSIASGLSVVGVVIVIAGPLSLVGQQVAQQIATGIDQTRSLLTAENLDRFRTTYPRLGRVLNRVEQEIDLSATIQRLAAQASGAALIAVKGSLGGLVQAVMVFFFLFFLLRDADRALRGLRALLPLNVPECDMLFRAIDDIVHGIMGGMMIVALAQGTLGALIFWALGLPAPILWGAVMAICSLLPTGTSVIWGPAAGILAMKGQWTKALILFTYGMLVIGLIDNLLYPKLVGKRIRLHIAVVFIAMLGGITLFGFAGLVLGPALFAVTAAILQIWRGRAGGSDVQATAGS